MKPHSNDVGGGVGGYLVRVRVGSNIHLAVSVTGQTGLKSAVMGL